MSKIQNNFLKATVNKDLDERLTPNGQMIDASNVMVISEDSGGVGVLKNVKGNTKVTSLNIANAETIGSVSDESNERCFYFVRSNAFDYIIEYNVETDVSEIVLQSTTGTRLNFIEGERILNCDIVPSAEGNGDIMIFSGDSNPPRAINIERAKTWGIDGFTSEEIMLIKAPPIYPLELSLTNSSENVESNNLDDKFISFTYRYKYKDGYYSAIASWTEYGFNPSVFKLDFETFENLGMLNIQNGADLTFNTGPREVEQIELIFKESGSQTLYLIEKFKKEDKGWADNSTQTVQYNNSKIYQILPESEYYRSFDNVPLSAVCQTLIGNRVAFANYIEQRNLIDKNGDPVIMNYTLSLVTNKINNQLLPIERLPIEIDVILGLPVILDDGKIEIDFDGVTLYKGSSIYINFKLKSNVQEIEFESLFSYVLEDDYTNLLDLLSNSLFVNSLEVIFEDFFENNGGITEPDNTIATTVIKTFEVSALADVMTITFPAFEYEIDETPDPNTYIKDYFYDIQTSVNIQNIAVASSLKSRRSYEICMIYRDLQGRKTTALTSEFNTLFIPNKYCVNQNQINVNIPATQLPPEWAHTYKFGIKVNKGNYEQIMASVFFIDGAYRWIKLDGENRNKVKEGDILVVKKDSGGPIAEVVKVKVLELVSQPRDFIEGNQDLDGQDIIEPSGLYMKIKPTNFEIDYNKDEFLNYSDYQTSKSKIPIIYLGGLEKWDGSAYQKIPIGQGSTIKLYLRNFESDGETSLFEDEYIVQNDYPSFEDWFNAEITLPLNSQEGDDFTDITFVRGIYTLDGFVTTGSATDNLFMRIKGTLSGAQFERSKFEGRLDIRNVDGYFIFETDPQDINNEVFFETPEVYTITDGEHEFENHLLTKTFNCYAFGNGAESYQIRDAFLGKKLFIDFCPTAVSEDKYREITRYADITYSEIYNENTNINKLNEFNLSLANFKDDIEKIYGPIYKLKGEDTNLEVYQEDVDSLVYYAKDLLFNADGTTNLTGTPQVLGQQKMYVGEYGISTNSDSYDGYGIRKYHTDVKRGVVVRKSEDGLTEISSNGMRDYFKILFRNNRIINIIGQYDAFFDIYILNIKYAIPLKDYTGIPYDYVTWIYSSEANGFVGRHTFNPDDMLRVNNHFLSFKGSDVYKHNIGPYSTFYGSLNPSSFEFNFNEEPSTRKIFKNVSIEGNSALNLTLKTDLQNGIISSNDFKNKEGVYYGYIRGNDALDLSTLAVCGIGTVSSIVGNNVFINGDMSSNISIGDSVFNNSLLFIGTITNIGSNFITLSSALLASTNMFLLSSKPSSVETSGIRGYYMNVKGELTTNSYLEVYALNSEVIKSFE